MLPSAERVEKQQHKKKTPSIAESRNFNPKSHWQSESQSEFPIPIPIPSRLLPTDHLRTFYHSQTGDIAV